MLPQCIKSRRSETPPDLLKYIYHNTWKKLHYHRGSTSGNTLEMAIFLTQKNIAVEAVQQSISLDEKIDKENESPT